MHMYICIYGMYVIFPLQYTVPSLMYSRSSVLYIAINESFGGKTILLTICSNFIVTPAPTLQIPGILDVPEIQCSYTLREALCIMLFSMCTGQEKSHCYSSEKPS